MSDEAVAGGDLAGDDLAGSDALILRCERVRAMSYALRARSQAALGPPIEPAETATFAGAVAWYAGTRTRVNLLDEHNLGEIPAIEAWFAARGLEAAFDVAPIAVCRPVARVLGGRGYQLVSWQPMVYRSLTRPLEPPSAAVEIVELGDGDTEFRDTFIRGHEIPERLREGVALIMEARWRAEKARRFLARVGGKPVAAATLVAFDDIVRLANAATLPEARNLGAQSALIRARLLAASEQGFTLATADAHQGSSSLRNLARAGFQVCAQITQWEQ